MPALLGSFKHSHQDKWDDKLMRDKRAQQWHPRESQTRPRSHTLLHPRLLSQSPAKGLPSINQFILCREMPLTSSLLGCRGRKSAKDLLNLPPVNTREAWSRVGNSGL